MNYRRQMELSELVTEKLQNCANTVEYLQFLRTQSRLYKYPFWQQAFIFAQNPHVTAVTTFEQWNKLLNRRIRPGTHGIAIPDLKRENTFYHVFDVVDTYATKQSRPVMVWEYREHYQSAVASFLSESYDGIEANVPFSENLFKAAENAVFRHLDGQADPQFAMFFPMLGEDADVSLELIQFSVFYELLNRCGMNPTDHYDFSVIGQHLSAILNGKTPEECAETVYALGNLTASVSTELLKAIEYAVKREIQKEHSHERPVLSPRNHRRSERAPAQPDAGQRSGGQQTAGTMGIGTPELSGRDESVRAVPDEREPVQASEGDRPAGGADGRTAESQPDGAGDRPRPSEASPEMGTVQPEPPVQSGRDHPGGADSGVTLTPRQRRQQRKTQVEGQVTIPFSETQDVIPQSVVDEVLRLGSNKRNSLYRIAAHHQLQDPDFALFIQNEFAENGREGGRGFVIGREQYAVWYDKDGMSIAKGITARTERAARYNWNTIADRIDDLISEGQFMPAEEMDAALDNERREIAASIWYLHQDKNDGVEYFLDESFFRMRGFPDSTQEIAEKLEEQSFLAHVIQGLTEFVARYAADRSILRFHYHNPSQLLQRMRLLLNEPVFHLSHIRPHEIPVFISEDEISNALQRGSNMQDSRNRIVDFFAERHTLPQQIEFLKNEYGIGGSSSAFSNADDAWIEFDGKGIELVRGDLIAPKASILLKWPEVARRMSELIAANRYIRPQQTEQRQAQQETEESEYANELAVEQGQ